MLEPLLLLPFSLQPQALIEELLLYKRSEEQIELKEKQLSTMRVDVCSTETLKCLKGEHGAEQAPLPAGKEIQLRMLLPWSLDQELEREHPPCVNVKLEGGTLGPSNPLPKGLRCLWSIPNPLNQVGFGIGSGLGSIKGENTPHESNGMQRVQA